MGIDPGLSGAIAFYWPDEPQMITVSDMPVVAGFVDCARLGDLVRQMAPSFAVIEHAQAMRKEGKPQGTSSGFNYGAAYGCIFGMLGALKIPHEKPILPIFWKRHFRLLKSDKEASRAVAIRLWPKSDRFSRKKDHGRAEAALIARYWAETHKPDVLFDVYGRK